MLNIIFRCRATELAKSSLQSSLLIRHPETKMFLVNLDPSIFEIFCEAKHLRKIGMDIPDSVYSLCLKEDSLKQNQVLSFLNILMEVYKIS